MTPGAQADPSLATAGPARPPAALGDAESPVVLAGPAGPLPFRLQGGRVTLAGRERPGVSRILVDGHTVAEDLRTTAGDGVNVVVGPASLRRELLGARGSVLEHALALPTLPLAVVQWVTPPNARPPADLGISFTLLPGAADVRYRADPGVVRAVTDGGAQVVEAAVHPPPTSWSVEEVAGGGIRVSASGLAAPAVTLLLAAGSPDDVSRAMAAAPHLGAHALKASLASDPARATTLVLASGVREMDHGVAWATARLLAPAERMGHADPAAAFWTGVGATAVGSEEGALAALGSLEAVPGDHAVELGVGLPAPSGALALLTAARTTLLTGDPAPSVARTPAADALAALHRQASPEAWPWWSLALTTLADALRWAAPEEVIDAIRAVAARPAATRGGVRLPMVGTRPLVEGATLLSALLRLGDPGDAGPWPPGVPEAWARFVQREPDAGYALWRAEVARGLEGDTAGAGTPRGSWDAAGDDGIGAAPGAPGAARVLATLSHGLLGFAPDAPAGRLGLAPAIPGHLTRLTVGNLRVGATRVRLSYVREGTLHRFGLDPLGGDVPSMVVLEPTVAGEGVDAVRVDGSPAELDARPAGSGRIGVRVQIPVDGPRTVEVSCT